MHLWPIEVVEFHAGSVRAGSERYTLAMVRQRDGPAHASHPTVCGDAVTLLGASALRPALR